MSFDESIFDTGYQEESYLDEPESFGFEDEESIFQDSFNDDNVFQDDYFYEEEEEVQDLQATTDWMDEAEGGLDVTEPARPAVLEEEVTAGIDEDESLLEGQPDTLEETSIIGEAAAGVGEYFKGSGMPRAIAGIGKVGAFLEQKVGQYAGIPALENYGKELVDYWTKKQEDFAVAKFDVNPLDQPSVLLNPAFWNYQVGQQAPGMALAMAAGPVAGPLMGGFTMSAPEAVGTYQEVLKDTGSESAATKAGAFHLGFNTILESWGLSKIVKPVGRVITRTAKGAVTEGGTEFSQELISKVNKDFWEASEAGMSVPEIAEFIKPNVSKYLWEAGGAGVVGAGIGGPMSAATGQRKISEGKVPTDPEAAAVLQEIAGIEPREGQSTQNEAEQFIQKDEELKAAEASAQVFEEAGVTPTEELAERAEVLFEAEDKQKAQRVLEQEQADKARIKAGEEAVQEIEAKGLPTVKAADVSADVFVEAGLQPKEVTAARAEKLIPSADEVRQEGYDILQAVKDKVIASKDPEESARAFEQEGELVIKSAQQSAKIFESMGISKAESKRVAEELAAPTPKMEFEDTIKQQEDIVEMADNMADKKPENAEKWNKVADEARVKVREAKKSLSETKPVPKKKVVISKDRDIPETFTIDAQIKEQQKELKEKGFTEEGMKKLGDLILQKEAKEGKGTYVSPKTKEKPAVPVKEVVKAKVTQKTTGERLYTDRADLKVESVEDSIIRAEKKEPETVEVRTKKEKEKGLTTEGKYGVGTRRRVVSKPTQDIIISQPKPKSREDNLVSAILSGKQVEITKSLQKLPAGERKSLLAKARKEAEKQSLAKADGSIDSVIYEGERATKRIGGRKTIAGAVEIKKTAEGMYEGTDPNTGAKWGITKTGYNEFQVTKNGKVYQIVNSKKKADAEAVVAEATGVGGKVTSGEAAYVFDTLKKTDYDYDIEHNRVVVRDAKTGGIVKLPDGSQGVRTQKQAKGYIQMLSEGKGKDFKVADFVATGQKIKPTTSKDRDIPETKQVPKEVDVTAPGKVVQVEMSQADKTAAIKRMQVAQEKGETATERLKKLEAELKNKKDKEAIEAQHKERLESMDNDRAIVTHLKDQVMDLKTAIAEVLSVKNADPETKAVLEMVRRVIGKDKLEGITVLPKAYSSTPNDKGSWFSTDENIIYYEPGVSPIVMAHEVVHSVTANELRSLPLSHPTRLKMQEVLMTVRKKVTDEGILTKEQVAGLKGTDKDKLAARKNLPRDTQKIMYGLQSIEEFFSMTMTDPTVRQLARETKLPKHLQTSTELTVWDKIKAIVHKYLKVPKEHYSALEAVLEMTAELGQIKVEGKTTGDSVRSFNDSLTNYNNGVEEIIVKKKKRSFVKDFYADKIRGVTGALRDIHPKIAGAYKAYNAHVNQKTHARMEIAKNWKNQRDTLSITEHDRYNLALWNYHDKNARKELDRIHKENPELGKTFNEVLEALDVMTQEMITWGLISKGRKHYFPNNVKDLNGLMSIVKEGSLMAEVKADLTYKNGQVPTDQQIAEGMSQAFSRGAYPAMLVKPGSTRSKTIWDVDNEIKQYYDDPTTALMDHFRNSTEKTEQHRMVGKSRRGQQEKDLDKLLAKKKLTDNEKLHVARLQASIATLDAEVGDSLGMLIAELAVGEEISAQDQELARNLISSKFNEVFMSKAMAGFKALSTTMALGQFTSTIIQVADSIHLMREFGVKNFFSSVFKDKIINADDLDAAGYLKDMGEQGWTSKTLEWSLKWSGFSLLDSKIKGIGIAAAIKKGSEMGLDNFRKQHGDIYSRKGEIEQLHKELRANEKTPLTLMFAFNELSRVQPITSAEMPAAFLRGKDKTGAVLAYMLKSYTVKQINNVQDHAQRAASEGIKVPGTGKTIKGRAAYIMSLATSAAILGLAGAGVDCIRNWVVGKDCTITEELVDNLLKIVSASRYDISGVARGRMSQTIGGQFAPPMGLPENIIKDVNKWMKGEASWQTMKSFPVVGSMIWGGFSQEAGKKKMKLRAKKIFAINKKIKMHGGSSKERRELRELRNEYNKEAKGLGLNKITSGTLRRSIQRFKRQEARKSRVKPTPTRRRKSIASVVGGAVEALAGTVSPKEAFASVLEEESQKEFEVGYEVSKIAKAYKEEDTAKTKAKVAEIAQSYKKGTRKPGEQSEMVKILGQKGVEGYKETLYTPGRLSAGDKSGITIGNGVDFGQQNIAKFRRIGVSEKTIQKITKLGLWGKRGVAAQKVMDKLTLSEKSIFTRGEVAEMSNLVTAKGTQTLEKKFGKDFWGDLTEGQKAVAMSLYHIYGGAWFKHNSFKQFKAQDWDALKVNMKDYKDRTYKFAKGINNRHRIMAQYI